MALNLNLPLPKNSSVSCLNEGVNRTLPASGLPTHELCHGHSRAGEIGQEGSGLGKPWSPLAGSWVLGSWTRSSQHGRGPHCPKSLTSSS